MTRQLLQLRPCMTKLNLNCLPRPSISIGRNTHGGVSKARRLIPYLFVVFFVAQVFVSSAAHCNVLTFPHVTTQTTLSKTTILAGQSTTVNVKVLGDALAQSHPPSARIVLVLDYSGSMASDIAELRAAAANFINRLDANYHEIAIVAFSDRAVLLSSPTSDYTSVISAINQRKVGGLTNIADALDLAVQQLLGARQSIRFGILFTDGHPQPDHSVEHQRQDILHSLDLLSREYITFHTVGLGNVDTLLLDTIARRTGGTFSAESDSQNLSNIFRDLFNLTSGILTTKAIAIRESISSALRVEDGTFRHSIIPSTVDSSEFRDEVAQAISSFYLNSEIEFPTIPEMTDHNYFSYSFEVSARSCNDKSETTVLLRNRNALIAYRNGDEEQSKSKFDEIQVTIQRCGVYLSKDWNESDRRIDISIHNALGSPIRELVIADALYDEFKIDWSRQTEFVLPPMSFSAQAGVAEWRFHTLDSQSGLNLAFNVKETLRAGPGKQSIQRQLDHGVTWKFEGPTIRIRKSESAYPQLKTELESKGPLSSSVLKAISDRMPYFDHVERGLGTTVEISGAAVTSPPVDLEKRGYEWAIKIAAIDGYDWWKDDGWPLEQSDWPLPGISLVLEDPFTKLTGMLYVKETTWGLEIVPEMEESTELPQIYTTAEFSPSP